MANLDQVFTSKYLKAADLGGKSYRMTIASVAVENIGTAEKPAFKPVAYFGGAQKGLALNKTNAYAIGHAYGMETDGWTGKSVEMYPDTTMFNGQATPCIRVRPIYQQATGPLPGASVNAPLGPTPPAPAFAPPMAPGSLAGDLDDDIPF